MEKHINNMEALIVEDEIDICFLLTGILRKKNLRTTYVNSMHEAMEQLSYKNPSILFLDNNLPDGYGVDFINEIKENHPLIRIIMITADDTYLNKNKAIRAGADYFIGKPFTRDMINKILDSVIKTNN